MKKIALLLTISILSLSTQISACTWYNASVVQIGDLGNDQFLITFELCQGDSDGPNSLTTGFLLDIQCATIDNLLTPSLTSTNGQTINATINGTTIEWGDIDDPNAPVFIDQNVNGGAQQCFTVDVIVTIDFNCTTASNVITYDFVAAQGAFSGQVYPPTGLNHCWNSFSQILPCTTAHSFDLSINQNTFGSWSGGPNGDSLQILDSQGNVVASYDSQTLFNLGQNGFSTTVNLYPLCFECGIFTINYYSPNIDSLGNVVQPKWIEVDFDGVTYTSSTDYQISFIFDSGIDCSIITAIDPTCPSNCDGSIEFNDSLLVAPVSYSIDGGLTTQANNLFSNLCLGTYYINVQDAGGFSLIDTVTLFASAQDVDLGPDDSLCDGATQLLDAGPNYAAYLWQDNSTNQTYNATSSGQYYVEVIDTNGCINRDTIELGIDQITAVLTNLVNESCNNALNGAATIQGILGSGNGQMTVTWTDPGGNQFATENVNQGGSSSQTGLYSGPWTVDIDDPFGCHWDTTFFIQVGSININTNLGHPQCHNTPTGSITAFSSTTGTFQFDITDLNGTSLNLPGTNTANSLIFGTYVISITDDNGCFNEITVELIDPLPLDVDINITAPPCYGDATGIAFIENVYNYQGDFDEIYFSWDPANVAGLGETLIQNQYSGEYTISLQDEIGCTYEESFIIPSPDPLIGVVEVISPTYCRTRGFQKGNGEVTVTTAGAGSSGTGNVTYLWRNLENGDESTTTTFIVNVPGLMEVTVTDDHHCTYIDTVLVDSLNPVAAFTPISDQFHGPGEFEGTEDMEVQFINESYNFSKPSYFLSDTLFKINLDTETVPNEYGDWFFSDVYNEKIKATFKGEKEYLVCYVASNFNDCVDTTCNLFIVHAFPELNIPNVFTPDAAPNNEFYFPSRGISEFDCGVYNRYGIEVFHYNSISESWDGNNFKNDKPCKDGVYFYSYLATSTNGTQFEGQGNIHLIRKK